MKLEEKYLDTSVHSVENNYPKWKNHLMGENSTNLVTLGRNKYLGT
jgi:hypothetical protein